jgi:hypothetical protein
MGPPVRWQPQKAKTKEMGMTRVQRRGLSLISLGKKSGKLQKPFKRTMRVLHGL